MIINKLKKADTNTKTVLINTFMSFVIRGGALSIGLFTTPAYLNYFKDNSILGVWFTLLSILTWVLNFDLGISNGLRNHITVSITQKNDEETKKYISSAYVFLGAFSICLYILLLVISKFINWNNFFNISNSTISNETLQVAVIISITSIMLQFVLKLITSILFAIQKSFVPNGIILITNISLLVYVILANILRFNDNIIMLSIVNLIAVNLPLVVLSLFIFNTSLRNCKPSFNYFSIEYALKTFKTGVLFLMIQISKLVISSTNMFLIAKLISTAEVVNYNIYYKIFGLISSLFMLATTPIWSAVTKALAENNINWIRKIVKILYVLAFVTILLQLLIYPFGQTMVDFWLRDNSIKLNTIIITCFIIDVAVTIWSGICATISNGIGELKLQTITMIIGALINIPLTIFLVDIYYSISSVVIAHAVSLLPYCILQTISIYKFLRKPDRGERYAYS